MKRTPAQLYNDIEKPRRAAQLRKDRAAEVRKPLLIRIGAGNRTFDTDDDSLADVTLAISAFDAVRAQAVTDGWPDDGTIPWYTKQDTEVAVSLAQLESIRDGIAVRRFVSRRALKAAIDAL